MGGGWASEERRNERRKAKKERKEREGEGKEAQREWVRVGCDREERDERERKKQERKVSFIRTSTHPCLLPSLLCVSQNTSGRPRSGSPQNPIPVQAFTSTLNHVPLSLSLTPYPIEIEGILVGASVFLPPPFFFFLLFLFPCWLHFIPTAIDHSSAVALLSIVSLFGERATHRTLVCTSSLVPQQQQ